MLQYTANGDPVCFGMWALSATGGGSRSLRNYVFIAAEVYSFTDHVETTTSKLLVPSCSPSHPSSFPSFFLSELSLTPDALEESLYRFQVKPMVTNFVGIILLLVAFGVIRDLV